MALNIEGTEIINRPPEQVWPMLFDPEVLKKCIPGCEEVIQTQPDSYMAKVSLKIGPIKARFAGNISIENALSPEYCEIYGTGDGGLAGFAKGQATVNFAKIGAETELRYVVEAQIGGKLAQIGSRLLKSTTDKLSREFFASFRSHIDEIEEPELVSQP